MTAPTIGSQLDEEQAQRAAYTSEDKPASHRTDGETINADTAKRDFMVDLLDAQQDLITAQHQFLHGSDTTQLLAAQNRFIMAQMNVLQRLGVYGQ